MDERSFSSMSHELSCVEAAQDYRDDRANRSQDVAADASSSYLCYVRALLDQICGGPHITRATPPKKVAAAAA